MRRALPIAVVLGCASESPAPEPLVTELPGVVLATVTLTPTVGLPGSTVHVAARIPRAATEAPLNVVSTGTSTPMGAWRDDGDAWVAEADITATSSFGAQPVGIQEAAGALEIRGWALFTATAQAPCPAGQVREAGTCHPVTDGRALRVAAYAQVSAGHPTGTAPDDSVRTMLHPRQIERVGSATVGCHSDHLGILWMGDFAQAGVTPEPASPDDDGIAPRSEVVFSAVKDDLAYCENFALISDTLAVTGHRGSNGKPGAVATWRLPDLSAPRPLESGGDARYDSPRLLDLVQDPKGFEGLLVKDGYLLAARKPNHLVTFAVSADGELTVASDLEIPGVTAAWNLALDGDLLFLSDPSAFDAGQVTTGPDGTAHYGHYHDAAGGRVFTLDLSDPVAPKPLGWAATGGASKTLAVLGEHHVAVANGAAGIEVLDATSPDQPEAVWTEDTPGTASDVSAADGHLLVADWDTIRLYDASEPGVLRLIDATDLQEFGRAINDAAAAVDGAEAGSRFSPPVGIAFARLQADGTFFANDLDRIFFGQLNPGARTPRLVMHDTRRSVRSGPQDPETTLSLRISNGGTEPVWARVAETDQVHAPSGGQLLAPGEVGALEVALSGLDRAVPPTITVETNDPFPNQRTVTLTSIAGQFQPGDPVPPFALPVINHCVGAQCDLTAQCLQFPPKEPERCRPILMAVFTSW